MKSWLKKAAGIIFTDGKSVLLLKRAEEGKNYGKWALPGGHAREGETEIGNAIREAKEETGLDSIPGHRFDSMSVRDGQKKFTTFFYRIQKPFDVTLSSEHSDYDWVPLEDLDSKSLHPKLKQSMPEYLHKIRRKLTSFSEWSALTETIERIKRSDG